MTLFIKQADLGIYGGYEEDEIEEIHFFRIEGTLKRVKITDALLHCVSASSLSPFSSFSIEWTE